MIRYCISLFACALAVLPGAVIARADTPAVPRVVAARDAPRASTEIPSYLRSTPRPEMLALVENVKAFRLTETGPAIPVTLERETVIALALTAQHLRVLLVANGAMLSVLLDAGVVQTVAVRQTILVPTREDLGRVREPQPVGIYLHAGDPLEVLDISSAPDGPDSPAAVAHVRHVRAVEATGFVPAQDTGKLYPSAGTIEPHLLRCDGRDPRSYRLRRDASLLTKPVGPVFATVKTENADDYILVGIMARRGRHALVCNVGYGVLAWVHARDLRPHPREKPGRPGMLVGGLAGDSSDPVAGPHEAVLPENTPLHDRPGGHVVGYISHAMVKPTGNAAPGDWVETRFTTDLGDIPVWFQVPRR